MAWFGKLLLAVDPGPKSEILLSRVLRLCRDNIDGLHVVHVLKHGMHDLAPQDGAPGRDPHSQRLIDHAATRLRGILNRHGVILPADRIFLQMGEPAREIKKLASRINADLVIVGSHTKEDDWMQLPGATTNCVIQGISSDVMAVKL